MLSDSQIDELEHFIFNSTTQDLPVVLGKALPLLFAELRVVRATLDSKVSAFLGEVEHDSVREESSTPLCGGGAKPAAGDGVDERRDGESEGSRSADEVHRHEAGKEDVCVEGADQGDDRGDTEKLDAPAGRKTVDRPARKQPRKTRKGSKQDDPVDDLPELT